MEKDIIKEFLTRYKGKTFSKTEDVFEWLEKGLKRIYSQAKEEGRKQGVEAYKKEIIDEIEKEGADRFFKIELLNLIK